MKYRNTLYLNLINVNLKIFQDEDESIKYISYSTSKS
jgi:hypothetical protein